MTGIIEQQLLPDEKILWQGVPAQGIRFRPIDALLIPFSILWGGFAIFWNVAVWLVPFSGPDLLFKIWGLPFLIVGLYIMFGRFIHDAAVRRQIGYAVTDRRAVIVRQKRSSVASRVYELRNLTDLQLEEKQDGSGSLLFENRSLFSGVNMGFDFWLPSLNMARFDNIRHVRKVYDLIQTQIAEAAGAR